MVSLECRYRKALSRIGLLGPLRKIKWSLFPPTFGPGSLHLLFGVNQALEWAQKNLSGDDADYLEFGVYKGFMLWYAQGLAHAKGLKGMRFFGFDSFQGLPNPKGADAQGPLFKGSFFCPKPLVERFLTEYGIDWSKTFLIEGKFEETLTPQTQQKYGLKRCGLCVIDSDFYSSAKAALNFLAPLIQKSCVVLFDDWGLDGFNRPDLGEQGAFSEFLKEHPQIKVEPLVSFGPDGRGFILHA